MVQGSPPHSALIASSGYNNHVLSIVDLTSAKVTSDAIVQQSWYGLALANDEKKVWWSAGGANMVHAFDVADDKLTRTGKAEPDLRKITAENAARMFRV